MPYKAPTYKALQTVKTVSPKIIAPGHGVVWSKHIPEICALYEKLCVGEFSDAATLVFDSMWGGTAKRAEQAEKELKSAYSSVRTFDLRCDHISDAIASLATSGHVCIGSPTYNNFPTPRISTLLAEIEALKPPIKTFSVFGTFGWGGGAQKAIAEKLTSLGLTAK